MAEKRRSRTSRIKILTAGFERSNSKARSSTKSHTVDEASKILEDIMKGAGKLQSELRILVTGKTGQGKSTLINGILGSQVAKEGARGSRCTTEVEVFAKTINGVPIKVFDSPGLQDRTANEKEYIQGMREQCQELSMILYCTKMTNPRLTDDDKNAMIKLTKAFGEHFWDYAVFVLTFANMEDVERKDDRDEDDTEPDDDDEPGWEKLMKKRFEGRLKIWINELQSFLIKEVGVAPKIAEGIPVVPTGDFKKSRKNKEPLRLPDRGNWFTEYWTTCCIRTKNTRLFLNVNGSRIITLDEDSSCPSLKVTSRHGPPFTNDDDNLMEQSIGLRFLQSKKIIKGAAYEEADDENDTEIIDELVEEVADPSSLVLKISHID